jgi:hypothetical protein
MEVIHVVLGKNICILTPLLTRLSVCSLLAQDKNDTVYEVMTNPEDILDFGSSGSDEENNPAKLACA